MWQQRNAGFEPSTISAAVCAPNADTAAEKHEAATTGRRRLVEPAVATTFNCARSN
jgi:hypothetical protein